MEQVVTRDDENSTVRGIDSGGAVRTRGGGRSVKGMTAGIDREDFLADSSFRDCWGVIAGWSPKHQFGSSAELERRLKRLRCGTTANKHAHFSIDKCVEVRYACCALPLRVLSTSIGGIGDDQSASRPRVGYCRQEDRKRTFRAQEGCAAASEITRSSARNCIRSALSSLRAGL